MILILQKYFDGKLVAEAFYRSLVYFVALYVFRIVQVYSDLGPIHAPIQSDKFPLHSHDSPITVSEACGTDERTAGYSGSH